MGHRAVDAKYYTPYLILTDPFSCPPPPSQTVASRTYYHSQSLDYIQIQITHVHTRMHMQVCNKHERLTLGSAFGLSFGFVFGFGSTLGPLLAFRSGEGSGRISVWIRIELWG